MVNYRDILAALDKGMKAFNDANLITFNYNGVVVYNNAVMDVAWENTRYEPTIGRPYQEIFLLSGDTKQTAQGASGTNFDVGVYQIDLHYPRDEGAGDLIGRADLIRQYFQRSRLLQNNGVKINVEQTPSLSPPRTGPQWYTRSVSVPYFLYT